MPTAATGGHGAKIQIGDGATPVEAFNDIPEITSEIPSEIIARMEEVTNQQSGGWKESIPTGVSEVPNIAVEVNWLGANLIHQQIETDARARTKRNFKVTTSDVAPKTSAFAGYLMEFRKLYPVSGKKRASFVIEPTGAVVIT